MAPADVQLTKRLKHPNVVRCVESFILNDTFLVIVMEHCLGGDLATWLDGRRCNGKLRLMEERKILSWFVQLLMGLSYVHSQRVLHRDLKPRNIFLDENMNLKIGDFGISRVMTATLGVARTALGTPQYMSPEMCENKPYTFKSDVWALGCVLYELCTLKTAFNGNSFLSLAWAISFAPVEPISAKYSTDLFRLIQSMLAKDPGKRPDAKEMLQDSLVQDFMQRWGDARASPTFADSSRVSSSSSDTEAAAVQFISSSGGVRPQPQETAQASRKLTESRPDLDVSDNFAALAALQTDGDFLQILLGRLASR